MRQISIELQSEAQNGEFYCAELGLPVRDSELSDAFRRLRLQEGDTNYSYEVTDNRHSYLRLGDEQDLFALNELARRMTELNSDETLVFRALVKIEQQRSGALVFPLQKLVNLSHSLDRCHVVAIENDAELGLFLYENDFLSDKEYELITAKLEDERLDDYLRLLGKLHRESVGGTFEDGMYIEFDGYAVEVYVNRTCPQVAIIEYQGDTCVECVYPPAVDWVNAARGSESVARFVERLGEIDANGQLLTYLALLESSECANLADALEAAEKVDDFSLDVSYTSPQAYAREVLGALNLEASLGVELADFVRLWDLGQKLIEVGGHRPTSYGLLKNEVVPELLQAPQIGGLQIN